MTVTALCPVFCGEGVCKKLKGSMPGSEGRHFIEEAERFLSWSCYPIHYSFFAKWYLALFELIQVTTPSCRVVVTAQFTVLQCTVGSPIQYNAPMVTWDGGGKALDPII